MPGEDKNVKMLVKWRKKHKGENNGKEINELERFVYLGTMTKQNSNLQNKLS
jgi:hypothetical protein